jgi:hypothetical protein
MWPRDVPPAPGRRRRSSTTDAAGAGPPSACPATASFVGETVSGAPAGGDAGTSTVVGTPVVAVGGVTWAALARGVVVVVPPAGKAGDAVPGGTVLAGGDVACERAVVVERPVVIVGTVPCGMALGGTVPEGTVSGGTVTGGAGTGGAVTGGAVRVGALTGGGAGAVVVGTVVVLGRPGVVVVGPVVVVARVVVVVGRVVVVVGRVVVVVGGVVVVVGLVVVVTGRAVVEVVEPVVVVPAEVVVVEAWVVLVVRAAVVLVVGPVVVVGGRVVVVTAAVVVVATAVVVVTGALAPEAPSGDDANELTGQARTLTATSASAAAPRRLPLVQGRPAVATFRVVLISVGNSTTVRGPCARRTEERYPESWPCLLFRGTTGRYGRDGNYVGFCGSPHWVLPALLRTGSATQSAQPCVPRSPLGGPWSSPQSRTRRA